MKSARKELAAVGLVFALFLAGAMRAAGKKITLPADNPMAQLKLGPGAHVARNNCAICHSTDYIVRQPGRTAAQWEAEVKKMITVFGAPISDDAKTFTNYLAAAYGPASHQKRPGGAPRSGDKATTHPSSNSLGAPADPEK